MKKLMVISIMAVLLVVGCATVQVETGKPSVFDEIGALAVKEGAREISTDSKTSGYIAYRKYNGDLYSIGKMDNGGVCIYTSGRSDYGTAAVLVGYYPNGENEFLLGVFLNGGLIGREPLTKEKAEEMAKTLFEEYKLGTQYQPNTLT